MDNDRAFAGRLRDRAAVPLAAIVVLILTAFVGIGLITGEPVAVRPSDSTVAFATASPIATSKPRMSVAPTFSPSGYVGLVGLPREGASPSSPDVGELVDTWWVGDRHPPYVGAARLYADGRLIWNRYYNGPDGPNSRSTGYIEQRLTAEGVALLRTQEDRATKSPWRLPDWLPLGAWQDRMPRPYVPSGYGVCLNLVDRSSPSLPGPREQPQLLDLLPVSVSTLLRTGEPIPAPDYGGIECVAQTTEEARVLDRALRDAGSEQDEFINRFMLQHSLDVPGATGVEVSLVFEPRFPDGSISCSACG